MDVIPRQVSTQEETLRGFPVLIHGSALCPGMPGLSEHAEVACAEPGEVQQGQVQGPAPGEEQPHAPVRAGADLLESSSVERDWECWGTTD